MWYKVRSYQSINTLVNKSTKQSTDQIINQTYIKWMNENEICKKPHVEQPRPPTVVSDPTGENSTDPARSPFHGRVQPGGIAWSKSRSVPCNSLTFDTHIITCIRLTIMDILNK